MTYLKWLVLATLKTLILLPSLLVIPQVIALFTRAMPQGLPLYTWGGWWGTFDNPPQGDEGFLKERAFFPEHVTGLKGYVNRVQWMWRNKLYGFNKLCAVPYEIDNTFQFVGSPDISDKYKIPGWYFSRLYKGTTLVAFEFYCVKPWSSTRDIRCRLGWKLMTRKFEEYGFAQLVNTCNPFDGYGDDD